ncbi:Ran gtpase-activating protein 2 [Globisporangium polare]
MTTAPPTTNVLSFDGERELVTAERAHELLRAYTDVESTPDASFTHITLRNKSYTLEAAQVIAGFFARLVAKDAFAYLTSVDFADMIAGRPEDEALQVLATLCDALKTIKSLTRIDLSDNALGEKGVRACFGLLLEQENLQHVYFCNNGISAAAAAVIADEVLLYRGSETPTKLETFHFYNNMSGDGGAIALAKLLPLSPALRDLRFSATRAQRAGSLEFAKALSSLHKLERIDLSDNTFKAEGGIAIAAALKQQKNLVEVNLRDASIEDAGMTAIAKALSGSSAASLTALDVSGNDLTADSARVLAQAVRKFINLRALQVEENEIGSRGAKALAKAIKSHTPLLEKLISNVNEIGTSGALALVDAIAGKAAFARIEIDGNAISSEGVDKIVVLLEGNKKTDVLGSLEDNDEDGDEDEEEESDDEEEAEVEPPSSSTVDGLAALLDKTLVISSATPEVKPLFDFENKQREVVNAARAHELLAAAGIHVNETTPLYYETITLRGKSYTEDGAQVIADAFLGRLKGLKVADLADVIAGRHEDEALRVLTIMCSALRGHVLDEIDLSDNALGEKGVRACFDLLIPQPELRRLLFCNNGISAAAAGVIAQEIILQNGSEAVSTLEEFHFYNNMSGHDGAIAVANVLHRMPKLTAFRYASARAGLEASEALVRNIELHLRNLTSLDVSDCSFEDEGADQLAQAVGKQTQLRFLKLRDASLGGEGAKKVLKALAASSIQLLELDLSGNELEDDGLAAIAPLLKKQTQLQVLRLDDNEITSEGVKGFCEEVGSESFPALVELSLCGNEITAKGALAVVNVIVPTKQHLERLELDTNQISGKGVSEVQAILARLGKQSVLGSLQENDGDDESDDE